MITRHTHFTDFPCHHQKTMDDLLARGTPAPYSDRLPIFRFIHQKSSKERLVPVYTSGHGVPFSPRIFHHDCVGPWFLQGTQLRKSSRPCLLVCAAAAAFTFARCPYRLDCRPSLQLLSCHPLQLLSTSCGGARGGGEHGRHQTQRGRRRVRAAVAWDAGLR